MTTSPAEPAGRTLLDAVAVMDRLRSPGGCPWDAEQTHASLAPYAVEEAHELAEVAETGDRDALVEELGDLLLQVLFHARVGTEGTLGAPFDIDDVAATLIAKLVRRHPHVFADGAASTPDEVNQRWDEIKATEKPRSSVLEGIPAALPALARAQKVLSRAERAGIDLHPVAADRASSDPDPEPDPGPHPAPTATTLAGAAADPVPHPHPTGPVGSVADDLLAAVRRARTEGIDAEAALRSRIRDVEATVHAAEAARS
ncbi:MazG family protein [Ruania zhangjianzhongii]|uniref:MazG family protein n=1 Tax=Ruania zhangjianzhongii TaxID=2603206 RepID=UPI001F30B6FE|nr:MazG family protein [Ruania zhangjianzhongii]